jgi:hypothetical protein
VTPAVRRARAEPAPTGISPTTWLLTLVSVALRGSTVQSTGTLGSSRSASARADRAGDRRFVDVHDVKIVDLSMI